VAWCVRQAVPPRDEHYLVDEYYDYLLCRYVCTYILLVCLCWPGIGPEAALRRRWVSILHGTTMYRGYYLHLLPNSTPTTYTYYLQRSTTHVGRERVRDTAAGVPTTHMLLLLQQPCPPRRPGHGYLHASRGGHQSCFPSRSTAAGPAIKCTLNPAQGNPSIRLARLLDRLLHYNSLCPHGRRRWPPHAPSSRVLLPLLPPVQPSVLLGHPVHRHSTCWTSPVRR